MANLTTKANIENYLKRALTTRENDLLALLLPAIDQVVANYLSRNLTAATGRLYDGTGEQSLYIDPVGDVTRIDYVASDGTLTEVDSDLYVLYPLNEAYKDEVRLRYGRWNRGSGNIKITSSAYTVPEDIKLAATILAADYLDAHRNNIKSESIEGYSVQYGDISDPGSHPEVERLLSAHKRILI